MRDRVFDRLRAAGVVFALACTVGGWAAGAARALGEVTYDQCFGASTGCTSPTGAPLMGARSVAVSPNDRSVYVAAGTSNGAAEGALSHFFVGARGSLSYDGCVSDDGSAGACLDVPGSAKQFVNPADVVVSPNSASVYTANLGGTVSHLFAAPQGQLSWDGCYSDDGSGGFCADVPGDGTPLLIPTAVAVSPSGGSLYSAAISSIFNPVPSAVSHFFADPTQGQLTWDGCVTNDGSGGTCLDVPGSGTPLSLVTSIAVSPNGTSLYAIGIGTLSHLIADATGGQLIWQGCISNDGSGGTCADVPGSGGPLSSDETSSTGLAVSPDGSGVYVADNGTVSHLFATTSQGEMTWDGCISDDGSNDCTDVPGTGAPLDGADAVAISPDGRSLYVASVNAGSLTVFDVAPQGQLTFKQCVSNNAIPGCAQLPGDSLAGADGVAVSPDGGSVYVAGSKNGTLVHFFRTTTSGGGGGGSSVHTATARIGNQLVTLSSRLPSSCLAKASSLTAKLSSTAIAGSRASQLSFAHAGFYIDRGIRHVNNGAVTYTPNQIRRQQPTSVSFRLSKLSSGTHTLSVRVFFHKTVTQHGHRRTKTVSTSLKLKFSVC